MLLMIRFRYLIACLLALGTACKRGDAVGERAGAATEKPKAVESTKRVPLAALSTLGSVSSPEELRATLARLGPGARYFLQSVLVDVSHPWVSDANCAVDTNTGILRKCGFALRRRSLTPKTVDALAAALEKMHPLLSPMRKRVEDRISGKFRYDFGQANCREMGCEFGYVSLNPEFWDSQPGGGWIHVCSVLRGEACREISLALAKAMWPPLEQ